MTNYIRSNNHKVDNRNSAGALLGGLELQGQDMVPRSIRSYTQI